MKRRDFFRAGALTPLALASLPTAATATDAPKPASRSGGKAFRFAQITDSHLYGRNDPLPRPDRDAYYRRCLDEVARNDIDFIVHTGDMCTAGASRAHNQHFRDLVVAHAREHGLPVYFVRGNHDSLLTDREYETVYGPGNYHFTHHGWSFLALDRYSQCYESAPGQVDMAPATLAWAHEQLARIDPETPLVLLLHENPVGVSGFIKGWKLNAMLADHNLRLVLFGHVQSNYLSQPDGIPHATVTGDIVPFDTSPLCYNIVSCTPDGTAQCAFVPYRHSTPTNVAVTPLTPDKTTLTPGDDWPTQRGPHGRRFLDATLPTTRPTLAWKQSLPGRLAVGSPNVVAGVAYLGTQTRGDFASCTINAVDVATGNVRWSHRVDGSVDGGIALDAASGRGWFGTTNGTVYAINLRDGQTLWTWNNGENLPIAAEPCVHDDLVHVGANWEMYALAADTGAIHWRRLASRTGCSYFSPGSSAAVVAGDRVIHARPFNGNPVTSAVLTATGEYDQHPALLQAMNARTGEDFAISDPSTSLFPGYKCGHPVVYDDRVYMLGKGLFVFAADDLRSPLQNHPGPPGSTTPALDGHEAIVALHTETAAYDLRSGERRWRHQRSRALLHYTGAGDTGERMDKTRYSCFASPLLTRNLVITADGSGQLLALDRATGAVRWEIQFPHPLISTPVITGNALLVGDAEGTLHGLALS